MNAERLATLAEIAAETDAILAGRVAVTLAAHDVANMQRELAEPFESCMQFRIYGRRTDADGQWLIALARTCRAKRAAQLAMHFARFAAAA